MQTLPFYSQFVVVGEGGGESFSKAADQLSMPFGAVFEEADTQGDLQGSAIVGVENEPPAPEQASTEPLPPGSDPESDVPAGEVSEPEFGLQSSASTDHAAAPLLQGNGDTAATAGRSENHPGSKAAPKAAVQPAFSDAHHEVQAPSKWRQIAQGHPILPRSAAMFPEAQIKHVGAMPSLQSQVAEPQGDAGIDVERPQSNGEIAAKLGTTVPSWEKAVGSQNANQIPLGARSQIEGESVKAALDGAAFARAQKTVLQAPLTASANPSRETTLISPPNAEGNPKDLPARSLGDLVPVKQEISQSTVVGQKASPPAMLTQSQSRDKVATPSAAKAPIVEWAPEKPFVPAETALGMVSTTLHPFESEPVLQSLGRASLSTATLPQAVVRQAFEAVVLSKKELVEITLDPPELGRLKMAMTEHSGAISVSIQAENSMTSDLLRRHQEMLRQDFLSQGYTDVSFSFEQQTFDGQGQRPSEAHHPTSDDITAPESIKAPPILLVSSGVDIRL